MKLGCSKRRWIAAVHAAAAEALVDPKPALARSRERQYLRVRWAAFRMLADENRSYSAIAAASGYDHTSVLYGCSTARQRKMKHWTLARKQRIRSRFAGRLKVRLHSWTRLHTPHRPGEPRVAEFAIERRAA